MHPNAELLKQFYDAFKAKDGATMAAAYAPDATFSDPAFPNLKGKEPGAMWKMLCARATDLKVEASGFEANDTEGKAHWEAWYKFNGKRPVHNVIDAKFTFKDGKIATHVDTFDFHRWAKQALGLPGLLLGGTGFLKKKVQGQTRSLLDAWMAKNP
jgi:ketosteroid isomerase-like protein